ncbi:hypothetical protein ACHAO9_007260 [Fusarium lateritium]
MPHAQSATPTIDNVELHVNDDILSPTEVSKLQPSNPNEPLDVLYQRYITNGYLLVKGLLTGWGDSTLPVRRTLLRNNTPGNKAIGVHYDQSFMRYGEPTAVTAWVPMGDIKLDGGGLIYLEGSEALGAEIESDFAKKAKEAGMSDEEMRNAFNSNMMSTGFLADGPADFGRQHGRKWLVSEYEAGDVVFHTPHMIHASTINHDAENRIRLGTDLRFVNSTRPWDTRWSKDFEFGDGV